MKQNFVYRMVFKDIYWFLADRRPVIGVHRRRKTLISNPGRWSSLVFVDSLSTPRLPSELPGYFLSYGDYAAFIKQEFGQRRQLYFCFKQERQLRTGLSGGCLRSIAQRTRSGARSYWIGLDDLHCINTVGWNHIITTRVMLTFPSDSILVMYQLIWCQDKKAHLTQRIAHDSRVCMKAHSEEI